MAEQVSEIRETVRREHAVVEDRRIPAPRVAHRETGNLPRHADDVPRRAGDVPHNATEDVPRHAGAAPGDIEERPRNADAAPGDIEERPRNAADDPAWDQLREQARRAGR